jgi:CTD small phosphatase-like protein 2
LIFYLQQTDRKLIHHRLFRDACLCVEGNFLKDLNVLGRDLRRTVLVDNSPHAFGYQVDNGIPIESWFECPNDTELLKLARFLHKQILPADDVRDVVRSKFASQQLVDRAPPLPQY